MANEFRETIWESLDNAVANGYELDEWDATEIANDLSQYDSQFEKVAVKDLIPHIKAWKEHRKC